MTRTAAGVLVGVLAVGATVLTAQSLTTRLGISDGRAREAVFDSIVSGAVSIAGKADAFTSLSPQARAPIVTAAASLARAFVESDEFARRYADHREANGPDPLPPPVTAAEVIDTQRANFEAQVEGMRKQFDEVTPEQRETLEKGFAAMRARFDEMARGDALADLEAVLKAQRGEQIEAHARAMAELDALYPADPRVLVAMRLRAFLDLSSDLDHTARLVQHEGKTRFVDAALEARPGQWKLMFRAGKPAVEAARAFGQRWLADLERKGVK